MISRTPAARGGNGGHQQRRRQRIPSGGHVAADAVERHDALFDDDAATDTRAPAARNLALGDRANIAGGGAQRGAHVRRHACGGLADLRRRNFDGVLERVEPARVPRQRGVAPAAHVVHDSRDAPSRSRRRAHVLGSGAPVRRVRLPESTMVSIPSDHDLVERIFDDPLAARRLEPWESDRAPCAPR